MQKPRVVGLWSLAATVIPALCFAQRLMILEEGRDHREAAGGPLSYTRVVNAPFSAEATTIVRMTTLEGRIPLERTATARYYRDRAGRVRVEQMLATESSQPATRDPIWITIDNPDIRGNKLEIGLDPSRRAAHLLPRLWHFDAVGGAHTFGVALGPGPDGIQRFVEFFRPFHYREAQSGSVDLERLGNREIEGVATVGHRTTITLPGGVVKLIDERWEAPDLQLLVESRVSDPRSGVIEYRLTNIKRREPPSHLFALPAGYEFKRGITPIRYEPWGNHTWR